MTAAIDGEMVSFDIDGTTDMLEAIADLKDGLRTRIARARLIFELIDVDHDIEPLVTEVEQFKHVCLALRGAFDA